jgi:peroxiredoxin Q/BCP
MIATVAWTRPAGGSLGWIAMAGPKVGDVAPSFELPGSGGRVYRLSDYQGSGVILAFYPGDFTTVCTKQLCSYRDDADRVAGLGVELIGISPQSVESHERFIEEKDLTVPLLADKGLAVAKAYGVAAPGGFVRRSIFVIDGDLVVRHRHVSLVGLSYDSVDDLEKAVAAIR